VLYRMLTGQPPYGRDAQNPLARLLHEEPPRPRSIDPTIPAGVEAVIQHAMARDPSQRPASALDLERELAAFDIEETATTRLPVAPAAQAPAAQATLITVRARRTRPVAAALASTVTACAALASAAILNATVGALKRSGGQTSAERFLVIFVASAIGVATATLLVLALVPRWRSIPALRKLSAQLAFALLAGAVSLGSLELLARGLGALLDSAALLSAGWATVRVAIAVGVAGGVAFWRARAPATAPK